MSVSLFVSPMVHAHRLLFPRLKHVSPYIKGNLLAEARRLNRAGYRTAAVATARAAVERRLREIAYARPDWKRPERNLGLGGLSRILFALGAFDGRTRRQIDDFADKANGGCHGSAVSKRTARGIIFRAAQVLSMLEGGAA